MNEITSLLEASIIEKVTEDGQIVCSLSQNQKLNLNLNPTEDIKNIRFEIDSWKNDNTKPEIQTHFFLSKCRSIDPKKDTHNLPSGIIICLRHMNLNEDYFFKIFPKYQNNLSIKNYPIETEEINFRLKILSVVKTKKINPTDFSSYYPVLFSFKQEGNEFYNKNQFEKAFDVYERGLKVFTAIPKKLSQKANSDEIGLFKEVQSLSVQLLNNLSMVCFRLNKYSKGTEFAQKCLQIDPFNVKAKYRLAKHQEAMKSFEEAMVLYKEIGLFQNFKETQIKKAKSDSLMNLKLLQALNEGD